MQFLGKPCRITGVFGNAKPLCGLDDTIRTDGLELL